MKILEKKIKAKQKSTKNDFSYSNFQRNSKYTLLGLFILVYAFPIVYILINQISALNFFGDVHFTKKDILQVLVYQFIYTCFWITIFKHSVIVQPINIKRKGYLFFKGELLLVAFCFALPLPEIVIYLSTFLFLILAGLGNVKIKIVIYHMILIGVLVFLFRDGRALLINSLLIYLLFITRSIIKIYFLGALLIFLAVFILLPYRHGQDINLSFDDMSLMILAIFYSITPMIVSAILSLKIEMTNIDLFSDYFPLGRTLTNTTSYIDRIAYELLNSEKYAEGVRVGSNAVAMFQTNLIIQSLVLFGMYFYLVKRLRKINTRVNNVLVFYLLWNFTIIPRRSFSTFISDSIIILMMSLIILTFYLILPKKQPKS